MRENDTVKAQVRFISTNDGEDFEDVVLEDPDDVDIWITVMAGPVGGPGEESFQLRVRSPPLNHEGAEPVGTASRAPHWVSPVRSQFILATGPVENQDQAAPRRRQGDSASPNERLLSVSGSGSAIGRRIRSAEAAPSRACCPR
ncbi:Imm8 family immunity protein [Curtobacterium sp. MCPF17_052]|uniref:Imm8 family immunity protein n=1 Tax=Curtobacterium sp. MCPF17_052 TaxID=2175655 RepID=UPI003463EF1D